MVIEIRNPRKVVLESPPHYPSGDGHMPDWPSWSIEEASERTGYNKEYLRRLIRQGKIEAVLIGRVYLVKIDSLQRYIEEAKESDDSRFGPK